MVKTVRYRHNEVSFVVPDRGKHQRPRRWLRIEQAAAGENAAALLAQPLIAPNLERLYSAPAGASGIVNGLKRCLLPKPPGPAMKRLRLSLASAALAPILLVSPVLPSLTGWSAASSPAAATAQARHQSSANKSDQLKRIERNIKELSAALPTDRQAAADALGKIGAPAASAVPALVRALHDPNRNVRMSSADALGRIGAIAVPALAGLVRTESDEEMLQFVALALRRIGSPAVPELMGMLKNKDVVSLHDDDADIRRKAALALEKIGDPAIPALLSAFNDKDYYFGRREIARSLGNSGDQRAVDPLIRAFNDQLRTEYKEMADALGNLRDSRAVESLNKALDKRDFHNWDVDVRLAAARALGKIADPRAVDPLIKLLGDESEYLEVRKQAAIALGRIGDPRSVKPLLREHTRGWVSAWGWGEIQNASDNALLRMKGPREIDELIAALSDPEYLTRASAARILGKYKAPRAVDSLLTMMDDKEAVVRYAATVALGEIGDRRAVNRLIQALGESSLVKAAIESLGEIGDPTAVDPLVKISGIQIWNQKVPEALGRIKDRRSVEPLLNILNDAEKRGNWDVAKVAAAALGETRDRLAVEPLIRVLGSKTSVGQYKYCARAAAAKALGAIGDSRAVDPLVQALGDEDVEVRLSAAEVLGHFGDARGVEPLLNLLNDSDPAVREAAAEALGNAGDRRAIELLIKGLVDPSVLVRERAAIALAQMNDSQALQPLSDAAKDPDAYVRLEAAKALDRIHGVRSRKTVERFAGQRSVESLLEDLQSADWRTRIEAVKALETANDSRAIQPLVSALSDVDEDVSAAAASALATIENDQAVTPLLHALERSLRSGDPNAAELAAKCLAHYRDPRFLQTMINPLGIGMAPLGLDIVPFPIKQMSIADLIASVEKTDWSVSHGIASQPEVAGLISWYQPLRDMIDELGNRGDQRATPVLLSLVRRDIKYEEMGSHVSSYGSSNALLFSIYSAIGKLHDTRAVPALIEGLGMRNAALANYQSLYGVDAGMALKAMGKVALPGLEDAVVNNPSARIRGGAADLLGDLGDPAAIPALEKASQDPLFEVSYSARRASQKIKDAAKLAEK